MTNNEAQAYAVVALNGLIKAGIIKTKNKKGLLKDLDREMYYLMDRYSEDEIVEYMEKLLTSNDEL